MGEHRYNMNRNEELTTRFNAIDTNSNKKLELGELQAVFGAHAEEFLKFCDQGDKDKELTVEEFTAGIIADCTDLSDADFQTNWLDRMSGCIAEAKPAEAAAATKESMQACFVATEGEVSEADWCGELKDLFSPDDKNPDSRRFIDVIDGALSISADTGGEKWGRKFEPEGTVNPVLAATDSLHKRVTNFETKIPADAPDTVKAEVAAGALSFTVTMGTCDGKKVLMWPGLYDGKGGSFTPAGGDVPASACDNFWEYV